MRLLGHSMIGASVMLALSAAGPAFMAEPRQQPTRGAGKGSHGKRRQPAYSRDGVPPDVQARIGFAAAAKRLRKGQRWARIVAAGGAIALVAPPAISV